jgi:ankyrin repeat protein
MTPLDPEQQVEYLLKAGADPNADTHASTLRLAAGGGHTAVVELLLDYGADPDFQHAEDDVRAPLPSLILLSRR